MGKVIVVVGGQYGSEAKGHVCAFLGERESDLLALRVGGPNAGHTAVDEYGEAWPFRHIPVAAVRPAKRSTTLMIAPGSEVDLEVLESELQALNASQHSERATVLVAGTATLLTAEHKAMEEGGATGSHGSTKKGIGAARAERILRHAPLVREAKLPGGAHVVTNYDELVKTHLTKGGTVLIEGTQGYALGTHAGHYPYCTGGDARAIDFLAQAGISPWAPEVTELEVWVVFRTFPIRIAGNSGPMHNECTWEQIGVPPEFTTVTKKQRRVSTWDSQMAARALRANGGDCKIALMFADYLVPDLAGTTDVDALDKGTWYELEHWLEQLLPGRSVDLVGTGPGSILDLR